MIRPLTVRFRSAVEVNVVTETTREREREREDQATMDRWPERDDEFKWRKRGDGLVPEEVANLRTVDRVKCVVRRRCILRRTRSKTG
jgi:hypothetical protein